MDPGVTSEELYDYASASDDLLWQQHAEELLRLQVCSRSFQRDDIIDALILGGIDPIPAADLVASFRQRFSHGKVAVLWDQENIKIGERTSGFASVADAVSAVRSRLGNLFGSIHTFNLYSADHDGDLRGQQLGGATHCIAPHLGRKEVADKMILVDAISFAFENFDLNPIVVIASCDSDFSALLSRLNLLGVKTISITADGKPVRSMRSVAAINLSWPSDFSPRGTARGRVTGYPAMMDGSPITPHPAVSAALLSVPMPRSASANSNEAQQQQQQQQMGSQADSNLAQGHPAAVIDGSGGGHLPPTPNSSIVAAPFPRSATLARVGSLTFGGSRHGRHGSFELTVPTPASLSLVDEDEDAVTEAESDVQALHSLMNRLVEETGSRRIRRNVLGQAVKRRFGPVNLASLVSRAVEQHVVDVGGSGTLAWVGLLRPNAPSAGTSRGNTPRAGDDDDDSSNSKGPEKAAAKAQAVASGEATSTHPTHVWPPAQDPGSAPREYWLSYRLLKDRLNSQAILGIKRPEVQPYCIVDTEDSIAPARYVRRAFGPFASEFECMEFASGLANASWAAPRVLVAKPTNPGEGRSRSPATRGK